MDCMIFEGARVLLVEDEMLVSMLIEGMLDEFGCEVVGPAPTVQAALALIHEQDFDCAILDVNVGGTWVYPVADALKARGCPYAFSTGYGGADLREEDSGAPLLQKPFREADLRSVITRMMASPSRTIPTDSARHVGL
jgi:CheY-like chemotaxis protein